MMSPISTQEPVTILDLEPAPDDFLQDVLAGLGASCRTVPCKYLYDRRGSQLFDRICGLPEYYPTRTEIQIMRRHAADIGGALGPGCLVVEYGSGSSTKTPILLDGLEDPGGYVAIDISRAHVVQAVSRLSRSYPDLRMLCVCADYTQPIELPRVDDVRRRVVYFPGSTIGNFHRRDAVDFLCRVRGVCEEGGGLLIGVDLKKSRSMLERAYNDAAGVTARFNLNVLERMNRELDADFDLAQWRHRACYDMSLGRIEMHLVSARAQWVHIREQAFAFGPGESIRTEVSYKYALEEFADVGAEAGFAVQQVWMDAQRLFSVQFLTA